MIMGMIFGGLEQIIFLERFISFIQRLGRTGHEYLDFFGGNDQGRRDDHPVADVAHHQIVGETPFTADVSYNTRIAREL